MNPVSDCDVFLDVSRETQERLDLYVALLKKWTPKINLVSKTTISTIWSRHILDCAQLMPHIPESAQHYVDLGSGGGFPGLVVAIIATEKNPKLSLTLVESDIRKATFLRTVLRETNAAARVLSQRAESTDALNADVITARALADMSDLMPLVQKHLKSDGIALLQKGSSWKQEVEATRKAWSFSTVVKRSITDPNAVILKIGEIAHV